MGKFNIFYTSVARQQQIVARQQNERQTKTADFVNIKNFSYYFRQNLTGSNKTNHSILQPSNTLKQIVLYWQ